LIKKVSEKPFKYVKRFRNKRFQKKTFIPNFFLPLKLGGLGLKCEFSKNKLARSITSEQRKLATYYMRNPQEIFLIEKVMSEPSSCKSAIELFRKIKPNLQSWLIDSKPVSGPLNKLEDPDVVQDMYLQYCLRLKSWVLNKETIEDVNLIRYNIRKALCYKETPVSINKIFKFMENPFRFRVFDLN
jgi:hypothetical protein